MCGPSGEGSDSYSLDAVDRNSSKGDHPDYTRKTASPRRHSQRCPRGRECRDHVLLVLLILGVLVGVGIGALLRGYHPFNQPKLYPQYVMYINFPGELLMRFMKLLSLPLIITSLISGVASLDAASSGRIGVRTLVYYVGTTCISVCEGFAWIYAIKPGADVTLSDVTEEDPIDVTNINAFLDLLRNLFPDNLVTSTFQTTKMETIYKTVQLRSSNNSTNETFVIEDFELTHVKGLNILGLTVLCIILGVIMASMGEKSRPLVNIIQIMFDIVMKLVNIMIWVYPIGIMSLVAATVIGMDNPVEQMRAMGKFLGTVLAGEFTHFFIVMPLIYLVMTRRNPFRLMYNVLKALFTAFATANSTVTLPVTMECLESKHNVAPQITRFMCPIGSTVNMDGFALYESMAVIFVAMLRGMDPGPLQVLCTGFTAVALSIGAPTTGGGLVLYAILFQSLGLPLSDIALLIPFDWFLSRFRTTVNVWGDCVGTCVVQQLSMKDLRRSSYAPVSTMPMDREECNIGTDEAEADGYDMLVTSPPATYTLTLRNEGGDVMRVSKM